MSDLMLWTAPPPKTATTIGLDIAKSIFQLHSIDAAGNVVIRELDMSDHTLTFVLGASFVVTMLSLYLLFQM